MTTNSDPRHARLAEREKRKRNTVRYILAWMEEYDYEEAKGIIEILVEEGLIDEIAAVNMAAHLDVNGIED